MRRRKAGEWLLKGCLFGVPYMIVATIVGLPLWVVALGFLPGLLLLAWIALLFAAMPEGHHFAIAVALVGMLGMAYGWQAGLTFAGGMVALRLLAVAVDWLAVRYGFGGLFGDS